MLSTGVIVLALVFELPKPTTKLALFDPPLTLSEPAPVIVRWVVIGAETLGLPTTNTPFTVAFSPVIAALLATFSVEPPLIVSVLTPVALFDALRKLPIVVVV